MLDLLRRVESTPIPPQARVFCDRVNAAAIADVMRWYGEARQSVRASTRHPLKLTLVLKAHPDEIEVEIQELKVRSYRKRHVR